MTQRSATRKALMRFVLAAVPLGLSACATANGASNAVNAVLLNPQDGPTRQAIRVFVREQSGPSFIANPDSLANSPILTNHHREIDISRRDTRAAFKPSGDYRLVMDDNNHCWMIHTLQEAVSQVQLPASANCTPYQAP